MPELTPDQVQQLITAAENQKVTIEALQKEMNKWKIAAEQRNRQIQILTETIEEERRQSRMRSPPPFEEAALSPHPPVISSAGRQQMTSIGIRRAAPPHSLVTSAIEPVSFTPDPPMNLTGGMKIMQYKTGGDVDTFLERFNIYCSGMSIPPHRQASVLLHSLDEPSFRVICRELTEEEKGDINVVKEHMKKRFSPTHGEGQLRLLFRQYKQDSQDLQSFYMELLVKATKAFPQDTTEAVDRFITDQLIAGCSNEKVRLYLIERHPRSSREALDLAVAYQAALEYNQNLAKPAAEVTSTIASVERGRGTRRSYRGGKRGYYSSQRQPVRQYANTRDSDSRPKCFNCGKRGHMARGCRNSPYRRQSRERDDSKSRSSSREDYRYRREKMSPSRSPNRRRNSSERSTSAAITQRKSIGDLLFVSGKIDNFNTHLFVDCGSSISLISHHIYQQFRNKNPIVQSTIKLQTASQQPLKVLGKTTVNIEINGTTRKEGTFATAYEFYVAEELAHNILLGIDFLRTFGANIDTENDKLILKADNASTVHRMFRLPSNGQTSEVRLDDEITIPARSQMVTFVKTSTPNNAKYVNFSPVHTYTPIQAAHTVLKIADSNDITLRLLNPTNEPVSLKQGTLVGMLEEITEDDIIDIQTDAQNEKKKSDKKTNANDQTFIDSLDVGDEATTTEQKQKLKNLMKKYINVFSRGPTDFGKAGHVKHKIELIDGEKPKRCGARPLHPKQRAELKKHLKEMLDADIIRPSTSEFSAPVVLVKKKDGTTRFCVDYRNINKVTKFVNYPLPRIDDALNSLGGAKYFTCLDLRSGYFQIEMDPQDMHKTAFATTHGLYEFTRMPQGLQNSAPTFQRAMECMLTGLQYESVIVYLDDLIVFGSSIDEHNGRLEEVLKRLEKANLKLAPKKCHFLKAKVQYLGHIVSRDGIKPDPEKVRAICDYPRPANTTELKSFNGLTSYYRKFIRNFAQIASPLNRLLEKNNEFVWNQDCEHAFTSLKRIIAEDITLAFPNFTRKFRVTTDASSIAICAALSQIQDNDAERPVSFISRTLSKTERKWSTIEREAFAMVWALEQFRCYLYGQKFELITDHRPLVWLRTMKNPNSKLTRWIIKLDEFDFEVIYKQGRLNNNADALSRIELPTTSAIQIFEFESELTETEIREEQHRNVILRKFRQVLNGENITTNKNSKLFTFISKIEQFFIESNDIIYKQSHDETVQIVLPPSLHNKVLQVIHEQPCSGHLGIEKTEERFLSKFYWPNVRPTIIEFVRRCEECAIRKPSNTNVKAPLQVIKTVRPLQLLVIDFVGPYPRPFDNKKYILTCIDHYTKYGAAYATENADSQTVVRCLEQFCCTYGIPETILSDNGRQFTSSTFDIFCDSFGIKVKHSTSYHSQTQGICEKFNSTLTKILATYTSTDQNDWTSYLSLAVFAYNTSIQASTKISPHEAMFGVPAKTSFDSLLKKQEENVSPQEYAKKLKVRLQDIYKKIDVNQEAAQQKYKEQYDKNATKVSFPIGSRVWLDNPAHKVGTSSKLNPKM